MRLHDLQIEGFGHFHDHTVGPLDTKVTVLHGPNEVGKSTLLAFIRTILFGFPARRRDYHYPPLSGGRHGGRITLFDDEGVRYRLERFAGPRGGRFLLRNEFGDGSGDPGALERLTGHATLDLFSNVFAFSLDEIQNEGLMSDSEVSSRLYSAGMGSSGLPEFVRNLGSRKDELFRPRGSAQKIAKLLRELNGVDGQLRAVRDNADEYRRLILRQDAILAELDAAEDEISKLNTRLAEIDRLLEGWNDWITVEGLEAQLRDIPEIGGFPDNPIGRLEDLENRVRQAEEDRDKAEGELRQISEAVESSLPDEGLLDVLEPIEAIRRGRSSFDGSVRDLPERHKELGEMEDVLSGRIRELGHGWDKATLDYLDTSLAVRQQVEVWRDQLNKSAENSKDAAIRLEESRDLLEKLRTEERQAQSRLVVDSPARRLVGPIPASGHLEELLGDQEEVERTRHGRGSFDDSVRDLPERQAERGAQETEVARQLRALGKGWDERRLDDFDTSIVFRQSVDDFRQRLAEQADRVRRSGERLERERTDLNDCRAAVEQAQARVPVEHPPLDALEIELRMSALRTTRSRLDDHGRARNNLENLRAQLASLAGSSESAGPGPGDHPSIMVPLLLGVAGIALMLVGAFLGQESLILGIVAGVILFGSAGYQVFHGRGTQGTPPNPLADAVAQNVRLAEAGVDRTKELLVEAAQPIGLDDVPTADALDNAEAGLEVALRALSAWNEANGRVEETNLTLGQQEQRVNEADKQTKSAVESESRSRVEWQQWLQQHGLDEGLTPETVVEFTGRIDTTRAVLQNVRQMRQRVAAIEVDIDEYRRLVEPLAERYSLPFDEANLQRIMAAADNLIESFDFVRQLVNQRDDVLVRLGHQERAAAVAEEEHRRASQVLKDRQSVWRAWLRERGLNESFNPDALLEFLARAETAHASTIETRRMQSRVAAIEADIDQFRDQVRPLAEAHGITLDTADHLQLAMAADALISRLSEVQRQVSERQQARHQQTRQRNRLEQLKQRLKSIRGDLKALLAAGAADDAEGFRLRARLYAQRQGLEKQREERLSSLRRLSGPDKRLVAFRDSLATTDPDRLRNESGILSEQIDALNERREGLREERGRKASEIDRLTGEEESSTLRIRRNVLMEQLLENAREWSRLTIAGSILEKTQKKFEHERQPNVIQHAEEFFTNVTGRRYKRLYAPVGERTIAVTDASGRDRRPPELSRGTREQLYLALRFGLIREFGEHAEHLPVVVDEALVNFDAERARLAAASFAKLSETNQVLVFTCHSSIIDTFVDVGASAVEIGRSNA